MCVRSMKAAGGFSLHAPLSRRPGWGGGEGGEHILGECTPGEAESDRSGLTSPSLLPKSELVQMKQGSVSQPLSITIPLRNHFRYFSLIVPH